MMYYKIGFTRVGGQGLKDGWQTVNAPPTLPPEVIGRYGALQNANVACVAGAGNSGSGERIETELLTDGYSAYLSKIKYGLADVQGRPSMFADSFICDLKSFAEDPGGVLRLLNSDNFSFEINDVAPPAVLSREFETEPSIKTLGLDANQRALLMKCVYNVMTSRAKETLHLICDCSDETIANTMYCIYSALFLPFRKALAFATYESGAPKTIVFAQRGSGDVSADSDDSRYKYFDLSTGDTNISDSAVKKFSGYAFIDDIARFPEMATLDYFRNFEAGLREYGCAETLSLSLYKLVWDAERIDGISEAPPDELLRKLNELLSADAPNRRLLDEQILKLLLKAIERQIPLNEIMLGKLARVPSVSDNELLNNLCSVFVYGQPPLIGGDDFVLPDFADNAEQMTFEIVEQQPVEIPAELFSDEEMDSEYRDEEQETSGNPIKRFMKKFAKK